MTASNLQLLAMLNMVLSLLLPLAQQAVTHINASGPVKVVVTAAMSAVVGFVTPFVAGDQSWSSFNVSTAALSIGSVFFISVLSHYGLWKPVGVTGDGGAIANALPGGVGAPEPVGQHEAPDPAVVPDPAVLAADAAAADPAPVAPDPASVAPEDVPAPPVTP